MQDDPEDGAARPGPRGLATALGAYALVIVVATYPMARLAGSALPSNVDPVQHLTVMRWYKTCLLEGRSPFLDREIQHPVGVSIGNFSPMHLQTLAYLALSTAIADDVLCYNLLWFAGFLLTGMGTFVLACRAVGDRMCAWFAGLSAMLCGPMMLHAHGHLELMYVGWFPLFLVAWMRLVDRPGGRAAAASAATYGLMTLSSGYLAVLSVIPAAWYLASGAIGATRRGDRGWFGPRAARVAGFSAMVVPFALLAFSGQLWNVAHGLKMTRSFAEFQHYGVPWYGYVVPTLLHTLDRPFGFDGFDSMGHPGVECGSYLGLATIGLVLFAAIRRTGPRQPAFWWSVTALLVILSFGASAQLGPIRVALPGSWLFEHVFAFRMLRVPARFNLLASVASSVLAAAGLRHLIARWPDRRVRRGVVVGFAAIAVADLSMVPFGSQTIPPMPAFYGRLVGLDPGATFLEAPTQGSDIGDPLAAASGYWQSFHRGRTTGGYSSHRNPAFDDRLVQDAPFSAAAMADPDYPRDPEAASFGIVSGVRFLDYAWLYLKVHDLRFLVLHRSTALTPGPPRDRSRLAALLEPARVLDDGTATVFDRDRFPPAVRPVLVCAGGWQAGHEVRPVLIASTVAEVAAYNPDPDRELTFTLGARAIGHARTVRLLRGDRELARWRVEPGPTSTTSRTPPFRLPAGLQGLTIESDGIRTPYCLGVSEVSLRPASPPADLAGASPAARR